MKKAITIALSMCLFLLVLSGCFSTVPSRNNYQNNNSESSVEIEMQKASSSDNATQKASSEVKIEGTVSQLNAVKKAKSYLDYSSFSRDGLIDQLEFEGFSNEDSVYGVDHSGADWNEQAVKKAKSYLDYSAFSRDGLIKQLEFEGFTNEQAVYGAESAGLGDNTNNDSAVGNNQTGETVSQKNAVRSAKSYLDYSSFSRQGLIDQLEYEGYSNEDAVYGVDRSGADWNEQAVKKAKSYLDYSAFSRKGLIAQLEFEGFTHEQAVHGVDSTGL